MRHGEPERTSVTALSIAFDAAMGSVPSQSMIVRFLKEARFSAMLPPGVWMVLGTLVARELSSIKRRHGRFSVVIIVSDDQKPLLATDPSPPRATAMASRHSRSLCTRFRWAAARR